METSEVWIAAHSTQAATHSKLSFARRCRNRKPCPMAPSWADQSGWCSFGLQQNCKHAGVPPRGPQQCGHQHSPHRWRIRGLGVRLWRHTHLLKLPSVFCEQNGAATTPRLVCSRLLRCVALRCVASIPLHVIVISLNSMRAGERGQRTDHTPTNHVNSPVQSKHRVTRR